MRLFRLYHDLIYLTLCATSTIFAIIVNSASEEPGLQRYRFAVYQNAIEAPRTGYSLLDCPSIGFIDPSINTARLC